MEKVDYIKDIIGRDCEGAADLNIICAPTLNNRDEIDVISTGKGGLAVIRSPEEYVIAVHSAAGNPKLTEVEDHTLSMIEKLVRDAQAIGAEPVAFADLIDSHSGELGMIRSIGNALKQGADANGLAVMNGENAILGTRVNCAANVIGTMISYLPKDKARGMPAIFIENGVTYAKFDPRGLPLTINSDGIGTKTDPYERIKRYGFGVDDFAAMCLDDIGKIAATARVLSGIVETRGLIPVEELLERAKKLGDLHDVIITIDEEKVEDRILGYRKNIPTYNLGGSVVSTIDEERLKNLPKPKAGDYLMAVRSKNPNPRSNGITLKRWAAEDMFGTNWHIHPIGEIFAGFIASPSTIFYSVFKELFEKEAASSVYHMSGAAYNEKLAKPLAKHNLYAKINGDKLFKPEWRESALIGRALLPAEQAYGTSPMGNEAFITTSNPEAAQKILEKHCLESRIVSQLEHNDKGYSGVRLMGIKNSQGDHVYYSGKK